MRMKMWQRNMVLAIKKENTDDGRAGSSATSG
jgi:hypothetical protein